MCLTCKHRNACDARWLDAEHKIVADKCDLYERDNDAEIVPHMPRKVTWPKWR
jgi:hypothetical protein